ncbi:polysaccharide deacetylase family protein [Salinilacihabitans rarus]|uniref:polysaccharide deacetylase family protein n=1 Tax=Salinilacihabitans rarus TaxID=2961596 RepID=UPI0020C8D98C|nr:polysaccharide deacetylase family protein [Salinilacihabitans rarus]
MKRRAYLAAAAVALGGCASTDGAERSDDPDAPADPTTSRRPATDRAPEATASEGGGDPDADDGSEREAATDVFPPLPTWTVRSGSRSAAGDGDAVVLEAAAADARVAVAHEFAAPADLSGVIPGLAVRSAAMVSPEIRLTDADGDRIAYRRTVPGGLPAMRYNFGVARVDGDPDLEAVVAAELRAWAGEGRAVEFECSDLHLAPRPNTGAVLLQFDDGYETDYTEAFPILEEYGYPATTFVNADRVPRETAGGYPTLDLDQLEALRDAGWLIGNHTTSHARLSDLDAADQEAQIADGAEWLRENGFEEGARYFAYPFGDYDATTIDLVADHHELGFGGGGAVEGYPANPALCSRVGEPTLEEARTLLDRTAEHRGITSLFYHRLDGEAVDEFAATIEYLHDLEAAGDIEVVLPADLERRFLL